jgi:hypothetical protein
MGFAGFDVVGKVIAIYFGFATVGMSVATMTVIMEEDETNDVGCETSTSHNENQYRL